MAENGFFNYVYREQQPVAPGGKIFSYCIKLMYIQYP